MYRISSANPLKGNTCIWQEEMDVLGLHVVSEWNIFVLKREEDH